MCNCLFLQGLCSSLFSYSVSPPSSLYLFLYLLIAASLPSFHKSLLFPTDNHLFSKRLMFPLICSQLQSQSSLPHLLKLHPRSAHPEHGCSWFIHQTTESQLNLGMMLQFVFTSQAGNKHVFTAQLMLRYRAGFSSINTPFKQGFFISEDKYVSWLCL
jgi:hypothetical protein